MTREIDALEREIAETRADLDEALDLLQARLTPRALVDQALGHAQHSPLLTAGMGQMYAHRPMTALLMTAGMNWYMSRRAAKQEHDRAWEDAWDSENDGPSRTARLRARTRELASRAKERVHEGTAHMKERAHEMTEHLEESAAHARDGARENLSHMKEATRERMHEMKDSTRARMSNLKGAGKQRAMKLKDRARGLRDKGRTRAKGLFEKQPLVTGALLALAGAAMAAAFPATEPERRTIGPKARKMRQKAKKALVEGVERTTSAATSAIENVTTQIEETIKPQSVH